MRKNPILILHGWSDDYHSFEPLKTWLNDQGYAAEQVWFGDYESMEDHVTFDDLAGGLQLRFEERVKTDTRLAAIVSTGSRLKPFSLDVIVHSTGGLVVRHWLHHYIQDICGGDVEQCPIQRVIMLAPANFGSRLAAQGKSGLAKIFKGGVKHGFETGKLILEGLELGSPVVWRMAEDDLFSTRRIYRASRDRGVFAFILSGTATYSELKGLVAKGANEDGSDGTVRAAAASLNSIRITADYTRPTQPSVKARRGSYDPFAFALVPERNHSTIVPSDATDNAHPTFRLIEKCLQVSTDDQYETLRQEFDGRNEAFYAEEKTKAQAERVCQYQQFAVHVRDDMGNDVLDYRLDFHVVDDQIKKSTWDMRRQETLAPLKRYQQYTRELQERVIADIQPHSVNTSYRTFFVNLDELKDLQAQLPPRAYIGMNVDAVGPTPQLPYDTDQLYYLPVDRGMEDERGETVDFFKANTTSLVEIVLARKPTRKVVNIV